MPFSISDFGWTRTIAGVQRRLFAKTVMVVLPCTLHLRAMYCLSTAQSSLHPGAPSPCCCGTIAGVQRRLLAKTVSVVLPCTSHLRSLSLGHFGCATYQHGIRMGQPTRAARMAYTANVNQCSVDSGLNPLHSDQSQVCFRFVQSGFRSGLGVFRLDSRLVYVMSVLCAAFRSKAPSGRRRPPRTLGSRPRLRSPAAFKVGRREQAKRETGGGEGPHSAAGRQSRAAGKLQGSWVQIWFSWFHIGVGLV